MCFVSCDPAFSHSSDLGIWAATKRMCGQSRIIPCNFVSMSDCHKE